MKKIVLIEDDPDLLALLKYNLENRGFAPVGRHTGCGAAEFCRKERPDLIILDILLPDSDGLEICKGIRRDAELAARPIIFLTARASETDRVLGLELGANDYIVKPFSMEELVARVKIQLRTPAAPVRLLRAGPLELDRNACQVRRRDQLLPFTATEFRLLEFLMMRPGQVFTREQLLDAIWGMNRVVTTRTVDVYVLRLRQKIEADRAHPKLIRSFRGFGYAFHDEGHSNDSTTAEPRAADPARGASGFSGRSF